MNWIFNNPLGNLYGPTFLLLYCVMLVGCIVVIRWFVRRADTSHSEPPLKIAEELDPLQIAYLRGGDAEVIRTVMVDLVERDLIEEQPKPTGIQGFFQGKVARWKAGHTTETPTGLTEVHEALLSQFNSPKTAVSAFESSVQSLVSKFTTPWREWMDSEKLRVPSDALVNSAAAFWMSLIGLEILGVYKIIAAMRSGHHNLIILIGLMVVTPVVLLLATRSRRLSQRGQLYLSHLQTAFAKYSKLKDYNQTEAVATRLGSDPDHSRLDLSYSAPLFAVGLFGVSALEGSSFDPLYQSYRKAAMNSSGCSAGCSSGASGCGSVSCGSGCSGGGGGC
ncbi:MAG: TIGR04222 domain-containing membrane protein, partial [Pirellula sp.]